jgi:hypothetical protein
VAARDQESQEVMSAAMRYVKSGDRSELERFSLSVLRKADYQLSNRDSGSGYRRAITDRITELESRTDVIEAKPNFYGLGVNLNEAWRRLRQWWTKK